MQLPTTSTVPLPSNEDFSAPAWNYPPPSDPAASKNYLPAVEKSRLDRLAAIEAQGWLLPKEKLPGKEVLDVTSFYKECGLLSEKEVGIVESDATRILDMIKKRDWTSLEVVKAFGKSASLAHQVTNCLSTITFEEAFAEAAKLDEHLERTGKVVGPLHGLPVSLKENFVIKGQNASIGLTHQMDRIAKEDGLLPSMLREAGAVFFVKTTLPTMMNNVDCISLIYGHTVNAYNRNLASGGSSGGEAVLQALKGSPLGIGTDLGGSIRIPTGFNYQYGLKPSFGRYPISGALPSSFGAEFFLSVSGPMTTSLSSVSLFLKTMLEMEPWTRDPRCMPMPWKEVELDVKKLRVGIIWTDGSVSPLPPVKRGLDKVARTLKGMGVEVFDWDQVAMVEKVMGISGFAIGDGGRGMSEQFDGSDEPRPKRLVPRAGGVNTGQYEARQIQGARREFEAMYLQAIRDAGIDFLISPVDAHPASPHGAYKQSHYCWFWNVVDYPSLTFPVLRTDPAIDVRDLSYEPVNEMDAAAWHEYDPEYVSGAPVSLQLIGPRLQEERVVKMVEMIIQALGGKE